MRLSASKGVDGSLFGRSELVGGRWTVAARVGRVEVGCGGRSRQGAARLVCLDDALGVRQTSIHVRMHAWLDLEAGAVNARDCRQGTGLQWRQLDDDRRP